MRQIDLFNLEEPQVVEPVAPKEESRELEKIPNDALELVKKYERDYSLSVAQGRAYPYIYDGAKTCYKRIIYGMWKDSNGKLQKVAELAAYALPYHPHPQNVGQMVTALGSLDNTLRWLDTQGNFGGKGVEASAERYIEGKLNNIAKELLCDGLQYTEMVLGEIDKPEPKALPALLPLCYINGYYGIPSGVPALHIPCLNLADMFDYYMDILKHKNLDYVPKIVPRLNTNLEIISGEKEWEQVVKQGKGKIKLAPIMERVDDNTIVIKSLPASKTCDNIFSILEKEIAQDKVDVRDESTSDTHIVIEKVFRKQCDMNEVYDKLYKKLQISQSYNCCFFSDEYIYVSYGFHNVVKANLGYVIETHTNKLNCELKAVKEKLEILGTIQKIKSSSKLKQLFDKDMEQAVEFICKTFSTTETTAKQVLAKPMSYLTKEHQSEIDELKNEVQTLETNTKDIWAYLLEKYKKAKKDVLEELKKQAK